MAVPKKKRYKQVVKHRRTLQKNTLLLKKNLTISKFTNYANNTSQIDAQPYCNLCKNKGFSNNICEICYVDSFLKIFLKRKEYDRQKERKRNKLYEYYVKLSKTLFSLSGS
ncbi:MAG TPA: hypothetical protein PKN63_10040 [Chitinophagales bacterium]|jgi:hypothetical protein|nr:hypothetical protein [Chitinophagales bacterium]